MADEAEDTIDRMYGAVFRGDRKAALACCTPDAQWHPVTPGPALDTLTVGEYFDFFAEFSAEHPDYQVLEQDRRSYGDFVVTYLVTTLGRGTMTFRLIDGLVDEIWALNAEGRRTTDYF